MNIEESMLIRGGKELVEKILSFMNTLVIKNEQEALVNENKETFFHYEKLKKCVHNITDFNDHVFPLSDLPGNISQYDSIDLLNYELKKGNQNVIVFIKELRKEFIDNYIDKNPYYAKLTGNPVELNEIINIIDRDNPELKDIDVTDVINDFDFYNVNDGPLTLFDIRRSNFPNFYNFLYNNDESGNKNIVTLYNISKTVQLHRVKFKTHSNTYTDLYIDGLIDDIKEELTFEYLDYIKYKLDIHEVRNAGHFDILWFNSNKLDSPNINNFFKSYISTREYIFRNKYIKNMEEMYKHYSNFELLLILFGTFQRMCNSLIDRYNVRDYSDKEILDILDSHNLSSLRNVSMSILRRVVNDLDMLLSYRGTEEVLSKIMDVVSKDQLMSVQRYDLVKRFNADDFGNSILDTDKGPYNANTNLAFVDRTILSSGKDRSVTRSDSEIYDYEDFVMRDPYWALSGKYENEEGKKNAIEKVKRKLLTIEFNRMDTKYIGVVSTINLYQNHFYMINKMGLLLQYYDGFRALSEHRYQFDGVELTPLNLITLASACNRYIHRYEESLEDYDQITEDCFTYTKLMKLNKIPISDTIDIILNLEFKPYIPRNDKELSFKEDYTLKVGDVLSKDDIIDYIIHFNEVDDSFEEVIRQYDINFNKFIDIILKSLESNDYFIASAWKKIREYFTVSKISTTDYIIPNTFTNFFETEGTAALPLFLNNIKNADPTQLKSYLRHLTRAFINSISPLINEEIDSSDYSIDVKISRDLNSLIDAFASIYVELREVLVNLNLSDYPFNRVQFMDRAYYTNFDKFRHLYNLSFEFSNYEFNKIVQNFIMKEIYIDERLISEKHKYLFKHKYSLGHSNVNRSLYKMIEFYGLDHLNSDRESLNYIDKYKLEDI